MATLTTKEKILKAALELFNKYGLANVRLQMIADESGISVGNLAYHFKNKKAIVHALSLSLRDDFFDILAMYGKRNDLLDFDAQLDRLYDFVLANPSYFLDSRDIRNSFSVKEGMYSAPNQGTERLLTQLRRRFFAMQEAGWLEPEPVEGYFAQEGLSIWLYIVFLSPAAQALNEPIPSRVAFKRWIWSKFEPFFTREGRRQFDLLISPLIHQD